GGVNDRLAKLLRLNNVSLLAKTGRLNEEPYGIGRCGKLPRAVSLGQLAQELYRLLPTRAVRLIGNENKVVKRVAVLGGAGSHWLSEAIDCGADVFITADVTYHDAQFAEEAGIGVLDPGHYAMEQPSLSALKDRIELEAEQRKWSIEASISEVNTDPFKLSIKK
ncbi:MAG: NGG1p interacting factor 3 protein, partial [Bacilli bacterium]|nr:NGG1p interacting factor 3 protein [Bacilli bacterium]